METHIDWLAWTVVFSDSGIPETGWKWDDVQWHIAQSLGANITASFEGEGWEAGAGRPPYAYSFRSSSRGVTVFWSGKVSHALIEVSGLGMSVLRQQGLETEALNVASARCTRIDVATDIPTSIEPLEFASQRAAGRTKARGSYVSKMGQTEYIGSRQSERYARVYRYSPPHPRSHLLRVEHECKGDTAKAVCAAILREGVSVVQRDLGNRFGWLHPAWEPEAQTLATFGLPAKHREGAKTELWLRTQVAAAFKKLVADGIITDPEAWVREVLLNPT